MPKKTSILELTFTEACEYLALSPDELAALRETGMIACLREQGKQLYPKEALDITLRLLRLGDNQQWTRETLAWYSDLCFATAIGRALLLPIDSPQNAKTRLSASWLETPNITTILGNFESGLDGSDETLINLLRSIVAGATGDGQLWPDDDSLQQSSLYPIITHFENLGHHILEQGQAIARDAGPILGFMVMAFTHIAPPMSTEVGLLIETLQPRLQGGTLPPTAIPPDEQMLIQHEALIAVDRLYASKAAEIHSQPEKWEVQGNIVLAQRRTIQLVANLPLSQDQTIIDNILDLIRPYLGPFGARVVHLIFEICNDAPYFRNPLITVDTNELLDRLGLKRTADGYHHSKNRERLRDALNAAHYLEIVGEYPDWEDGKPVTRALRKTVLSLVGATYDQDERHGISTGDLFARGLPKSMQIRLNFYDGVRRPDGRLGSKYVLMTRLAAPDNLPKANYGRTSDSLKAYFLLRYRQLNMKSRTLSVTRQTALEKGHITNKNASRATMTLRKALERLIEDGTLESYSPDLPTRPHESFEIVLSAAVVLPDTPK